MHHVAQVEKIDPELLRIGVADGTIVIPLNKRHTKISPVGIGKGLSIKVNANFGTSGDQADLEEELSKLRAAIDAKADTIMDLSTGGDITEVRRAIMKRSSVPEPCRSIRRLSRPYRPTGASYT
jgi:phosphomethylpyrimidine synthase